MRGRRWIVMVTVMVAVALVAGCGTTPVGRAQVGGSGGDQVLVAKGVDRAEPGPDAPVDAVVAGLTAFGHNLLGAMDADGNVVVSPLSIGNAFGMAEVGARGETAAQLDKTFGFPATGQHEALNALLGRIATQAGPPAKTRLTKDQPPVVAIANGLFVRQGYPLREDYLRVLASQYGAGARAVDFEGGKAAPVINDWVKEQTAGRIDKLFDSIDPDIRLVLANAVYLKASWAATFDEHATSDEPFHRRQGDVRVPMMHDALTTRYAAGDGWQAVELPYAKGDLAMWVLVPKGAVRPLDLLSPATMKAVDAGLARQRVKVAMPRWDFATKVDLKETLRKLGMTLPFAGEADFSGMTDAEQLTIWEAIHRANITVDETGTEAAAVTGVAVGPTSAEVAPALSVRADHPFAFAIVHKPTRMPLFTGIVADPSAK